MYFFYIHTFKSISEIYNLSNEEGISAYMHSDTHTTVDTLSINVWKCDTLYHSTLNFQILREKQKPLQ